MNSYQYHQVRILLICHQIPLTKNKITMMHQRYIIKLQLIIFSFNVSQKKNT